MSNQNIGGNYSQVAEQRAGIRNIKVQGGCEESINKIDSSKKSTVPEFVGYGSLSQKSEF
jgi:hypothetical protein